MIKFIKKGKRQWDLEACKKDFPTIKLELNLSQVSLTNRFSCVKELFDELNKLIPEFSEWYYDILFEYIESDYNYEVILESKDRFLEFANLYLDKKNINYSKFVDKKKSSTTSVFFDEKDIRAIGLASTCLKMYSIFQYDLVLKVSDNINKIMYDHFITECKNINTTDKIFNLIRGRNFRSSISDRYMWDLIKITVLENPETNTFSVFNFFMKNLLVLLDVTQNPVHYLVRVTDDNLKWLMLEIYKEKIIYDEAFGNSEIIYGSSISKESFSIYCCNDIVSKCSKIGLEMLENEYNLSEDEFNNVRERFEEVKFIDPSMKLFSLPIISKVLNIPYKFLLTTPPKHLILISIVIYKLMSESMLNKYPVITNFLLTYSKQTNVSIIRSSYKLRESDQVLEDNTKMFGINSRKLKFELISPIIGILSSCKKNLYSIIDGKSIPKITYTDLEEDSINFYTALYSNKLEDDFKDIRKRLYEYF